MLPRSMNYRPRSTAASSAEFEFAPEEEKPAAMSATVLAQSTELWLPSWRPWFALYNVRLRVNKQAEEDNSDCLLLSTLPDEMILLILRKVNHVLAEFFDSWYRPEQKVNPASLQLPPYAVATCACTCRHLKRLAKSEDLWRHFCVELWGKGEEPSETMRILSQKHDGSW